MTVFGDPDRLMQLFNNLLENSLRYTDSGGGLHISAEQRDKSLFLTFADSAPGVSDEQLQKLFDRFYRTEVSCNPRQRRFWTRAGNMRQYCTRA